MNFIFTVKLLTERKDHMIKEHTLLESVIERKNHYQGRMAENMTNIIYFGKRKAKLEALRDALKADTEERAAMNKEIVAADSAISRGKENIEQDELLLSSFDDMIKEVDTPPEGLPVKTPSKK